MLPHLKDLSFKSHTSSQRQQRLRENLPQENHTLSTIPPTLKDLAHGSPQPTLSQMTNGENKEKVNHWAYVCPQIISVLRPAGISSDPLSFCLPNCRPPGNDTKYIIYYWKHITLKSSDLKQQTFIISRTIAVGIWEWLRCVILV